MRVSDYTRKGLETRDLAPPSPPLHTRAQAEGRALEQATDGGDPRPGRKARELSVPETASFKSKLETRLFSCGGDTSPDRLRGKAIRMSRLVAEILTTF